jgi:hypothetical protein
MTLLMIVYKNIFNVAFTNVMSEVIITNVKY